MEPFQEVYEKYFKRVFRFLYRLSGDEHMAEELTQETMYKAFLHIEMFQGRSSIYTWLCEIGKNAWLSECRRQNRFQKITKFAGSKNGSDKNEGSERKREGSEESWGKSSFDLEQDVISRWQRSSLREEIAKLPEPYRNVMILRIYAELEFREIAGQYEKSESWARVTFFRGKTMLTERMERYR